MIDLHCPTPRPIPIKCVRKPIEICTGLAVREMKTFPHIVIEPNSFRLGLGLGLGQCKHTITPNKQKKNAHSRKNLSSKLTHVEFTIGSMLLIWYAHTGRDRIWYQYRFNEILLSMSLGQCEHFRRVSYKPFTFVLGVRLGLVQCKHIITTRVCG